MKNYKITVLSLTTSARVKVRKNYSPITLPKELNKCVYQNISFILVSWWAYYEIHWSLCKQCLLISLIKQQELEINTYPTIHIQMFNKKCIQFSNFIKNFFTKLQPT